MVLTVSPQLSQRAASSMPSAIRDLLEQAQRSGMISLAGGLPDASQFPLVELAEIAYSLITTQGQQALQYGPTSGSVNARAALAIMFDGESLEQDPIITTGSQQALDLLARTLIDPGDVVVVGDPDYLGALQVFRGYGASLAPVAVDECGLDTVQLESDLQWGLRPKACYIVPHFHNPTGATMTKARRDHLNELSMRYGFVVIEDDPYRMLRFDGSSLEPAGGDPELTVRLRSTSKVLAPGLRVGAMTGPAWILDPVVIAKQSVDLHTSSLSQEIAAEAMQAPWFHSHVDGLRTVYRCKRDVLSAALTDAFDGVEMIQPQGGMFVWARFPQITDTTRWLGSCLDAGVCFVPGSAFAVARDLSTYARMSFATASADELQLGIERMKAAV